MIFADFLVDRMDRNVGHLLVLRHRTAEEDFAVVLAVGQRSELLGQAPLGDHVAGDIGGPLDVVGRTGRHVVAPNVISSAMRPPNRVEMLLSSDDLEMLYLSSSGRYIVTPSARPRGMIVTLYTGS